MSEEKKTLVPQYFTAIDKGDLAVIDKLFAPTSVPHDANAPERKGLDNLKRHICLIYTASPDLRHTVGKERKAK